MDSTKISKLLKEIYNLQKVREAASAALLESPESLDNSLNESLESDCGSMESYENIANERISAKVYRKKEDNRPSTTSVPVYFVRSEKGTYFWTN
ncbi:enhancer of split m4 protein-like [Musca vetustissima]|uniref:enhancer of split m4 protein-like n=1 Tax=Musca vetustissima TaxID=27455 RepID=UPI002AB64191|nr:enhancer of split m4 protein-like [Musca vetustissima]